MALKPLPHCTKVPSYLGSTWLVMALWKGYCGFIPSSHPGRLGTWKRKFSRIVPLNSLCTLMVPPVSSWPRHWAASQQAGKKKQPHPSQQGVSHVRAGNVKKPIGSIRVRKSCIKARIQCESGITLTAVISSGQPTKCLSRWTRGRGITIGQLLLRGLLHADTVMQMTLWNVTFG